MGDPITLFELGVIVFAGLVIIDLAVGLLRERMKQQTRTRHPSSRERRHHE